MDNELDSSGAGLKAPVERVLSRSRHCFLHALKNSDLFSFSSSQPVGERERERALFIPTSAAGHCIVHDRK